MTRDSGISFIDCIQSRSARGSSSNRSVEREIGGNALSKTKESGFTYRTTRGNRPRYRDLSLVSPLAHISELTEPILPKATERSRTRPLRSIYIVHTSVSLFQIRSVVGCRARRSIAQGSRRAQLDRTYTGDGLDRHCECVVWGCIAEWRGCALAIQGSIGMQPHEVTTDYSGSAKPVCQLFPSNYFSNYSFCFMSVSSCAHM